ncbi:MAG: MarR family winged helix-turn-helix transcriptional regulator [Coriobacteriaceae bacterium]|nr:MarR family winged helix-turn-helix transcriptional regulator [Coriobacteriaceae bacterium]
MGAIAKEQLIWPSTMSRRVSRLVEIGLVSLEQSHLDRRVNLGALTPYGNELTVELCQAFLDNLIPGSSLDRLGLELADVVSIVARMGRVPMSASGLIAFCYGMRACLSMRVADIVNLTGLQQATVSMTLRSMEEQAMMEPILFGGARGDRPHCKGGLRYITQCGQAYADELLRMTDAL